MAGITILPAFDAVRGLQADFSILWTSNYPAPRTPVDLSSGWTGTVTILDRLSGETLLTKPVSSMTDEGLILITLTEAETLAIAPSLQIGGRLAALMQVKLEHTDPALSQVWQGALSIAGAAE